MNGESPAFPQDQEESQQLVDDFAAADLRLQLARGRFKILSDALLSPTLQGSHGALFFKASGQVPEVLTELEQAARNFQAVIDRIHQFNSSRMRNLLGEEVPQPSSTALQ
jgi:hypothetical protein